MGGKRIGERRKKHKKKNSRKKGEVTVRNRRKLRKS